MFLKTRIKYSAASTKIRKRAIKNHLEEDEMKMLKGNIILIVILGMFSITLWSGCAGNLPQSQREQYLDMNWGKSFESARKNQILNPDAGKTQEPVVGLNGEAAEYGLDKYKESFKKQAEKTDIRVPLIKIGD
jgi:hypothetical protein